MVDMMELMLVYLLVEKWVDATDLMMVAMKDR